MAQPVMMMQPGQGYPMQGAVQPVMVQQQQPVMMMQQQPQMMMVQQQQPMMMQQQQQQMQPQADYSAAKKCHRSKADLDRAFNRHKENRIGYDSTFDGPSQDPSQWVCKHCKCPVTAHREAHEMQQTTEAHIPQQKSGCNCVIQ